MIRGNSILRYNSARLFAQARTVDAQINPISLVQDFQFGFNLNREEIKSIGYDEVLKPIVSNQRPYFSFSYFLSDVDNEKLFRMPVTAEQAVQDNIPLFTGLESFDFFFLSNNETQDFRDFPQAELSACAFINSLLTSYSLSVLNSGIIKIQVSFEADNVLFKRFDSISDYSFLEYDREDRLMTNRNIFQINDGSDEINLATGGFSTQGRVSSFDFSAEIDRKVLYDFGQYAHAREIKYPVKSNIRIDAFVSEQISGRLENIICNDRGTDFLLSNSRATCENPEDIDDKSGLAIIGAKLKSQEYNISVAKGDYLTTSIGFELDIPRVFNGTAGAFLSQHITHRGDVLAAEDSEPDGAGGRRSKGGTGVLNVLLEAEGSGRILLEVAQDMFDQLRDLQDR